SSGSGRSRWERPPSAGGSDRSPGFPDAAHEARRGPGSILSDRRCSAFCWPRCCAADAGSERAAALRPESRSTREDHRAGSARSWRREDRQGSPAATSSRHQPRARYLLPPSFGEQRSREVALAQVGKNDHDQLAGILRSPCSDDRSHGGRAAGDATQYSLFTGQPAGHLESLVIADRDHIIDDPRVENVGNEPRADALDLVRSRTERLMIPGLAEHRRVQGLDGDHLKRRFPALENLTATGDRPTSAHARDQNIDLATGVEPDLLGRGLAVNLRV